MDISSAEAYLIDWGTAIRSTAGPTLYEGGLRYASRRLLMHLSGMQLQQGGVRQPLQGASHLGEQSLGVASCSSATRPSTIPVQYTASDDLISLVRSLFALRHPSFRQLLEGSPSEDFEGIARDALRLWDSWLGESSGRVGWRRAEELAGSCDYSGLASALDALLE